MSGVVTSGQIPRDDLDHEAEGQPAHDSRHERQPVPDRLERAQADDELAGHDRSDRERHGIDEPLVARMRIADELGTAPTFIGTGGLISIVAEHTPLIQYVDPDLTLKGLVDIHALNRN